MICVRVVEQQGLIIQAQDQPCQSACNFLTSSKSPRVASEIGEWERALSYVGVSLLLLWLLPMGVDVLLWCFLRASSPLSTIEALMAGGEEACLLLPEVARLQSSPSCKSPFTTSVTADPLSVQLGVQALISARSQRRCHQSHYLPWCRAAHWSAAAYPGNIALPPIHTTSRQGHCLYLCQLSRKGSPGSLRLGELHPLSGALP